MILSILNSFFYKIFNTKLFSDLSNYTKYAFVTLSVFAILYKIVFGDFSFQILKLQHINLFVVLLILSLINLSVESQAWKILLDSYGRISFKESFKLICECYPVMSFSSNLLGSVLGKQSFFGTKKIGTNIYKNISFGLYQSLASISLAVLIIIFSNSLLKLPFFGDINMNVNSFLIGTITLIISILVFILVKRKTSGMDFRILLLTYTRSAFYYLQYVLVISFLYHPEDLFLAISLIAIYFLLKTIIPFMNIFGGIGTRELTLSMLFVFNGLNGSNIVLGALLIWFANFIFPNILGLISICKKRNCLAHSSS